MRMAEKIKQVGTVISSWRGPITVAYSGGKDSSTVLKLVLNSLREQNVARINSISVVYCDTGVENPIISAFVKGTLRKLSEECREQRLNVRIKIVAPALDQRFFVRIIGRGYPPPTQFFRWCTKDLRIRPVQKYIRTLGANSLVLVGTRLGESAQRDRSIAKIGGDVSHGPVIQKQIDGGLGTSLYFPIIDLSLDDVWECLAELPFPSSIDAYKLAEIYKHGGGECPVVREVNDKPCTSARFGCWTCTVVRRDKSAEQLLEAGYRELLPYHQFRHWLSEIRNDPNLRCKMRRNGTKGLGPFTLRGRKLILEQLRNLEGAAGRTLITDGELRRIKQLWRNDRRSRLYNQLEMAN